MKYLDTSWFLEALDDHPDASVADIAPLPGFFLVWALLNDLGGEVLVAEGNPEVALLKERKITPLGCGAVQADNITDECFNTKGNGFAQVYLEKVYFKDFVEAFEEETRNTHPFAVRDTWENYDKLAPRIDRSFAAWSQGKDINKAWWQFWK